MMRARILSALRKASPLIRAVFLTAVVIAGAIYIYGERQAISDAFARIDGATLFLALLAALAHVAVSYGAWRAVLLEPPASPARAARIFFIGQLGKYLPGGIWSFLALAEFAKDAGLTARSTFSAALLGLLASIVAGAILAPFAYPWEASAILLAIGVSVVAFVLAPLALRIAAPMLGRMAQHFVLPPMRAFNLSVLVSIAIWTAGGAILMVLAHGIGADDGSLGLAGYGAIYALAWIAGFVVFIAPAGVGAREGAMVAMLSAHMGLSEAVAIALLARVLVTLADFALGGLALAIRPGGQAVPATAQPPHQG